ncbi:type I pantothenate kinase [Actinocorallia sp. A-T 12471]|uniref:type I pantothenate kinase n=1 Tax=Actinocorallia sp. A-T 12471 TaxID=3089813 RepID=UPI0029D13451|nr:type I pantothenate kinase [Actinocorallia sp. A-T 12471]MDX6738348.1 type I pantothenate kinase [Actinocorallia sp. A-T 12471]
MNAPWEPIPSPYVEFSREAWKQLRANTPLTLDQGDLDELRGLRDPIGINEVEDVYLPLTRLLNLFFTGDSGLRDALSTFLNESVRPTPFVIGVAGSVAVGKSTVARLLQALLARWPEHPRVELVTTDNFLYPNAELLRRGLMTRKGFPESYDRRALLRFISRIKAGAKEQTIPVYSHLQYDILKGERQTVRTPDILIFEGINVLQVPPTGSLSVSDYFDFSIYVDAKVEHIRDWYVERFLALRRTRFADPRSYFHEQARAQSENEAVGFAKAIWHETNERNLTENILPTRARATLVLHKGPDHAVQRIRLRRI